MEEYISLNSSDPRCANFNDDISTMALFRGGSESKLITPQGLESVKRLDEKLSTFKALSKSALRRDIEDARGLTLFWDQLDSLIAKPDHSFHIVQDVKSVILASILVIFRGERHHAKWLFWEINTEHPVRHDFLLSRAIRIGVTETVELLLLCGADPWKNGLDVNRMIAWIPYQPEEEFLISVHLFLKLLPKNHCIVRYFGSSSEYSEKELQYYDSYLEDFVDTRSKDKHQFLWGSRNKDSVLESTLPSEVTWIHIGMNNMLMIDAIIRILDPPAFCAFSKTLEDSLIVPKDTLLWYLESSYNSHNPRYPPETTDKISDEPCAVREPIRSTIVFPYLKLTTIGQQEESRKQHVELQHDLKPYDFLLRFHHLARTLDESYYPGLSPEALQERNHDQVVTHNTDTFNKYDERDRKNGSTEKNAFVLMVPQLWLYRLGNAVVSAFPDYLPNSLTYVERGPEKESWQQDANLHLGLIINAFIEGFGKSYTQGSLVYPPTLDLFETRVVSLLLEVSDYVKTRPGKKSNSGGFEYDCERYFIHVISDVRSELAMIKYVLEQQMRVLKSFLEDCGTKVNRRDSREWNQVMSMPEKINKYTERVTKIDDDAGRIEKTIQDMLNLKRTYASIRETHNSLILSTAVIGFTVITIIFAPLAFLTALFALKIEGLEKLQVPGGDGTYHKGKISGIFASAEVLTLVLTGVTVWIAIKYIDPDEESVWRKRVLVWVKNLPNNLLAGLKSAPEKSYAWTTKLLDMVLAWLKSLKGKQGSKGRKKVSDPELPRQTAPQASTTDSSADPDTAEVA